MNFTGIGTAGYHAVRIFVLLDFKAEIDLFIDDLHYRSLVVQRHDLGAGQNPGAAELFKELQRDIEIRRVVADHSQEAAAGESGRT